MVHELRLAQFHWDTGTLFPQPMAMTYKILNIFEVYFAISLYGRFKTPYEPRNEV
jgi:hypothetical protein